MVRLYNKLYKSTKKSKISFKIQGMYVILDLRIRYMEIAKNHQKI